MDLLQNKIQVAPGAPRINQAVTAIEAGGDVQGHHGDEHGRFGSVRGVQDRKGRYSLSTLSSLRGDLGLRDTRTSAWVPDIV